MALVMNTDNLVGVAEILVCVLFRHIMRAIWRPIFIRVRKHFTADTGSNFVPQALDQQSDEASENYPNFKYNCISNDPPLGANDVTSQKTAIS
jgi:hypothetical protein